MFQKQPVMRRVLVSLAPIFFCSLYLYGLRALAITVLSLVLGFLVEFLIERKRGKKPSEAVLVTCALYALSMPPAVPLWIVAVGILFAVFMAKEVYGGFGRNVFNPAIAGRLFVYISFATLMQGSFTTLGAFGVGVDVLSGPTPLAAMRLGEAVPMGNLLYGFRTGSIGESSSALIVIAAIYLLVTKTASFRLMLSTVLSGLILAAALLLAGDPKALPLESLLGGSFLFVAVFMSTDPISAPKKNSAQWAYGALIGVCTILIRTYSLFPEGTSFAILIGNCFASFFDEIAGKLGKPKAAKAKEPAK